MLHLPHTYFRVVTYLLVRNDQSVKFLLPFILSDVPSKIVMKFNTVYSCSIARTGGHEGSIPVNGKCVGD